MSQQSAANGQGPVIARAGKRKLGYDVAQVDEFLARAHALYESEQPQLTQHDIQSVSFDLVKDGYAIAQVDAALSRLERAVVDKHTSWELAHGGRVPFRVRSEEMLNALEAHYRRAPKHRFKDGQGKHPSYDRKQVDRVVDQVIAKASSTLGEQGALPADSKELLDVTASRVANVIFTQRKGKRGYDERAVDYYLDVAVQLLSRLESFARVSDYATAESPASASSAAASAPAPAPVLPTPPAPVATPVAPAAPEAPSFAPQSAESRQLQTASDQASSAAQETQVIPPLFTPSGQPNADAQRAMDSFDQLASAEHSIFAPKSAPEAPAPVVPEPIVPIPSPKNAPSVSVPIAPAAAPAQAPAQPVPPVQSAPVVSDSLAALAQSVPQHVEKESAPTEAIAPVAESEPPVAPAELAKSAEP
ncbi:DivIVA domain-containing protein, partial [Bifidobacterium avesanii]|uniref:DivIVA domain-containing protein n=1 Tax=Bifidobacterium avesanii TaxID=1798157 RepID=UPI0012667458